VHELLDDAQDHAHAGVDAELVVEAFEMGVEGAGRDGEVCGQGVFGSLVKEAADGFEFPRGETERVGCLGPLQFSQ
jgi:hypothetical protein